jgi:hypothetical protein
MVLKPNEAKKVFTHIFHVVFGRVASTPLQPASEEDGIHYTFELINLDSPTIKTLQYTNSNNNNATTNVRIGDKIP